MSFLYALAAYNSSGMVMRLRYLLCTCSCGTQHVLMVRNCHVKD